MTQWEAAQKLATIGRSEWNNRSDVFEPPLKYAFTPGNYYYATDEAADFNQEQNNLVTSEYVTKFVANGLFPPEMVVVLSRKVTSFDNLEAMYEDWIPLAQKQVISEKDCSDRFEWTTIPSKNISKLLQNAFPHSGF